jgi:hypothetical protein
MEQDEKKGSWLSRIGCMVNMLGCRRSRIRHRRYRILCRMTRLGYYVVKAILAFSILIYT